MIQTINPARTIKYLLNELVSIFINNSLAVIAIDLKTKVDFFSLKRKRWLKNRKAAGFWQLAAGKKSYEQGSCSSCQQPVANCQPLVISVYNLFLIGQEIRIRIVFG
jgi:hypothetical protein